MNDDELEKFYLGRRDALSKWAINQLSTKVFEGFTDGYRAGYDGCLVYLASLPMDEVIALLMDVKDSDLCREENQK